MLGAGSMHSINVDLHRRKLRTSTGKQWTTSRLTIDTRAGPQNETWCRCPLPEAAASIAAGAQWWMAAVRPMPPPVLNREVTATIPCSRVSGCTGWRKLDHSLSWRLLKG